MEEKHEAEGNTMFPCILNCVFVEAIMPTEIRVLNPHLGSSECHNINGICVYSNTTERIGKCILVGIRYAYKDGCV